MPGSNQSNVIDFLARRAIQQLREARAAVVQELSENPHYERIEQDIAYIFDEAERRVKHGGKSDVERFCEVVTAIDYNQWLTYLEHRDNMHDNPELRKPFTGIESFFDVADK